MPGFLESINLFLEAKTKTLLAACRDLRVTLKQLIPRREVIALGAALLLPVVTYEERWLYGIAIAIYGQRHLPDSTVGQESHATPQLSVTYCLVLNQCHSNSLLLLLVFT